jgi:GNAT superfamily N-acetyltransferase
LGETNVGADGRSADRLGQAELLRERPDGVRIIRVRNNEEALPYRAAFAGAYQDIFSDPPYNERFFPSEAEGIFRNFLDTPDNITILAVRGMSQVVGFGIAVPAIHKADVTRALHGLIPLPATFYLAELGVLSSWRRSGLGRELIAMRLALIDRARYHNVVLRTSAVRNSSYDMYLSMGFEDMGVYMEVPARRVDGAVSTDRRLFLCRVLPPPDEAEEVHDPLTWREGER